MPIRHPEFPLSPQSTQFRTTEYRVLTPIFQAAEPMNVAMTFTAPRKLVGQLPYNPIRLYYCGEPTTLKTRTNFKFPHHVVATTSSQYAPIFAQWANEGQVRKIVSLHFIPSRRSSQQLDPVYELRYVIISKFSDSSSKINPFSSCEITLSAQQLLVH